MNSPLPITLSYAAKFRFNQTDKIFATHIDQLVFNPFSIEND